MYVSARAREKVRHCERTKRELEIVQCTVGREGEGDRIMSTWETVDFMGPQTCFGTSERESVICSGLRNKVHRIVEGVTD